MTSFDDPNRQAVGQPPIWTGAGEEPPPPEGRTFDPGEHTVADVEAYIAKHPDQADAVLKAEAKGKNRTTLTGDA
jgi:hypothetical protein